MHLILPKFPTLSARLAKRITTLVIAAALSLGNLSAGVTDLPHKTVNGTEYYYYVVKADDTTYGILSELGISYKELKKHNRSASDGIQEGMTLYFPYAEYNKRSGDSQSSSKRQAARVTVDQSESQPTGQTDVKPLLPQQDSQLAEVAEADVPDESAPEGEADEPAANAFAQAEPMRVAVMLPFMLDAEKAEETDKNDETDKVASRAMDFYRGFLLAFDEQSADDRPIKITTFDTGNDNSRVTRLLGSETDLVEADIIIGPDNDEQFANIAKFANTHHIRVINPFIVKDSTYMTNPMAMQLNVDQKTMYDKATDQYIDILDEYTPVFITNTDGRDDKRAFVDLLKSKLDARGISYQTIEHVGNMYASALEEKLGASGRYVFIPVSGSYSEFVKINRALVKYKEQLQDLLGDARVFGYPEWTTFRGDALESMRKLQTTIYSRFGNSPDGNNSISVKYPTYYGRPIDDGVPSMALLGHDLGEYIVSVANGTAGEFITEDWTRENIGDQNSMKFEQYPNGGLINTAVYIQTYLPNDQISVSIK